jgi:hypothetical protein
MGVRQLTLLAGAFASAGKQTNQLQSNVPMTMLYVNIPIGAPPPRARAATASP